jgi:hypothetical protein
MQARGPENRELTAVLCPRPDTGLEFGPKIVVDDTIETHLRASGIGGRPFSGRLPPFPSHVWRRHLRLGPLRRFPSRKHVGSRHDLLFPG